jgi:regulator of sigma D
MLYKYEIPLHGLTMLSGLLLAIIFMLQVIRSNALQLRLLRMLGYLQYKMREKDLKNHHLFTFEFVHLQKIKRIKFKTTNNSILFKLLLTSKVESNTKVLLDILSENKIAEWRYYSKSKMRNFLNELVIKLQDDTNRIFHKKLVFTFNNISDELYDKVINKPGGFEDWRVIRIQQLYERINIILEQDMLYYDNYKIMIAFLTEIDFTTISAIEHTIEAFKAYNGDLDNIFNKQFTT